jgi:subfamily B ATP-binding cassette protein MsbA
MIAPSRSFVNRLRSTSRSAASIIRLGLLRPWTLPLLIILGVVTSITESLGITLISAFLYDALAQGGSGAFSFNKMDLGWLPTGGRPDRTLLAAAIVGLISARGGLGYLYAVIGATISSEISAEARDRVHRQYLWMPYALMKIREHGELLDVLATQTWTLASAFLGLTRLIINLCAILVFGVVLLYLSWQITITAAIGSLLLSLTISGLSAPARRYGAQAKEINQELAAQTLITLQGLRTLRAFGQEEAHHHRFMLASNAARSTAARLAHLHAILSPAIELGNLAVLGIIVAFPTALGASIPITLAAVALLYRLQPHVRELQENLLTLREIGPSVRSVLAIRDRDSSNDLPNGSIEFTRFEREIRFQDVSLAYAGASEPAADGMSFSIPAGRTTALFGPSGAGKTTVVNLLIRLYEPESGAILIDGVALSQIDRKSWLRSIAVSGQDIELIEGTILDNLSLAGGDLSAPAITEAIKLAGLESFMEGLPAGLDTWIGVQGTNLSGGQRQRLGIARAILRDPQVLILDEAMNALDRPLEDFVRDGLAERFSGRTRIIITHRPETLVSCDHVVWIENGHALREGPPADERR